VERAKNIREVEFGGGAETDAPSPLGHSDSIRGSGNDLVRKVIQIGLQVFDILELASIQCVDADARRRRQSFQLARILRLALLHQPQRVTRHFAGVLIPAGLDEGLDEVFLALRQHGISGRHRRL
jgi:hypothetical protein